MRCTKLGLPRLSISAIYRLTVVLKATRFSTTIRFYPMVMKLNYLKIIMKRLRNAHTNSQMDMNRACSTKSAFSVSLIVSYI
jgi:hypothetical protein